MSNSTFNSLVQRYSHKDGKIHFDDYIHCIARLCTMFGMQLDIFITITIIIAFAINDLNVANSETRPENQAAIELVLKPMSANSN